MLNLLGLFVFLLSTTQPVVGQTPQPPEVCTMPFQPVAIPLTELGENEYVRMDGKPTGFSGGLYPNGSNLRPAGHEAAGLELSRQIQPLTVDGQVDEIKGRILFISIGMSNTASEFEAFIRLAHQKTQLNPQLVLINGALPNQIAERWANPEGIAWQELDRRITTYGYSPQQVQVAWVKLTNTGGGDFPQKAVALEADLQVIVQHLKDKFPNLKMIFLSSRTRSYTHWRGLSPEPLAYETGFAVKWLIEKQIQGDPELNFDPKRGKVRSAFLSWGPYLWADGEKPREDGFRWLASDLAADCTHPSSAGAQKIAQKLWEFFSTDTISRDWFLWSASVSTPTAIMKMSQSAIVPSPVDSTSPEVKAESTPVIIGLTSSNPVMGATPANSSQNREELPDNSFSLEAGIILLLAMGGISAAWWLRRGKK